MVVRRLRELVGRVGDVVTLRDVVGVGSLGLIVAGIWGLLGWQWAAIAAGLPAAVFYLWGEALKVRRPGDEG